MYESTTCTRLKTCLAGWSGEKQGKDRYQFASYLRCATNGSRVRWDSILLFIFAERTNFKKCRKRSHPHGALVAADICHMGRSKLLPVGL